MDSEQTIRAVTLETATSIIEAAEQRADEIANPMVITVVNPEGNLIAQHRMDDAWLASVDISRNKAFTAASLKMPTHELADPTRPGESLYGLQNTNEGRMVIFGGGYPLERDGEVVGAIGVSGGAVEQDRDVAEAGVREFEDLTS
ncbi:GlcG/HbpS family heme-binding protein [Haloterrigena alkaliphila]|uniref:Heme-binding protein n=1 Tax=Haloterrigena alkaliphila TaxID=2816475 RepID=A0A8A2VIJ1_9EURY|nr:heme-binding protein [Haloterrigena alkaliphila]QSX01167.1 heme-binding protein [Haloterrigena alkaliphila]